MTETEIRQTVVQVLKQIAPDTDPDQLQPDDNIRQKLDIDSFDALRFMVALDEKFQVETPEEDYGSIVTLKDLTQYIMKKMS